MALALCLLPSLPLQTAWARSALAPRHSGMEPPGGPRPLEAFPGSSPGRTAEGGMGYKDAYGNTLQNRPPEEKKIRKRPGAGAYGGYGKLAPDNYLPDPAPGEQVPLWSFQ